MQPVTRNGVALSGDTLTPCEAKPFETQHMVAVFPALPLRLSVSFDTVLSRVCFCAPTPLYKSLETDSSHPVQSGLFRQFPKA